MTALDGNVKKIVAVYNKYLVDLLLVQKVRAPGIRQALRDAGHRTIDPASDDHVRAAAEKLDAAALGKADPDGVLEDAAALVFEPLRGVPMSVVLGSDDKEKEKDDGDRDDSGNRTFLYVLATLAATHAVGDEALAGAVLEALSSSQRGGEEGGVVVLDDDVAVLLQRVAECYRASSPEDASDRGGSSNPLEGLMRTLERSKIGDVASEISKEIDFSSVDLQNPAELLDFSKLTDGNSVLGSIVSKVGSKIQGKLASGELKQEELMTEALGFLEAFQSSMPSGGGGGAGGNNMMADLLKMARQAGGAGGGAGGLAGLAGLAGLTGLGNNNNNKSHSAADRREKLREKILKKQAGGGSS